MPIEDPMPPELQNLDDLVEDLLRGSAKTENSMLKLFIRRANETDQVFTKTRDDFVALQENMKKLQEKMIRLQGAHQSYRDDIKEILISSSPLKDGLNGTGRGPVESKTVPVAGQALDQ